MKAIRIFILSLLSVLFAASCADKETVHSIVEQDMNVPVYMDYETFRSSAVQASARELANPGKIYFKDNYLFVVEYLEGIHVIDVSNPANPQNKTFITIPGCMDLAIRNQTLYADSRVDIVSFDISDLAQVKESGRIEDVLPYVLPPLENNRLPCARIDPSQGIVTGWEVKLVRQETEQSYYPSYPSEKQDGVSDNVGTPSPGASGGGSSSGISGSMARFGLYDNYLYVLTDMAFNIYELNDNPVSVFNMGTGGVLETVFFHDGHLFFGGSNGMYIYSLEIPSQPYAVGFYQHVTSCDPVVVQDHYAYITMRGGTSCRGNLNQLDIVKLSEGYSKIELIKSYPMAQPYGLGIDGSTLFVCDGAAGLKVYDATDKEKLGEHLLATFPGIQAYDVIPVNNYLFMIGKDGFYLYDYKDVTNIKQIGHIPVKAAVQ
ncbi:hypothetical protein FACS189435_0340 [Bacteroidia bacterium]|nr:hypothetical protein FACS189435_0340 [Bacteroidia bacterium]